MALHPTRIACLALLCAAAVAPVRAESFASSASSAGSASSGSVSDSIEGSSDASSPDRKVAEGNYRITEVAQVEGRPGTVRLKKGGGVAGHNGLKDIAARLGPDFWRLRIGIGHPGDRAAVTNYVLHPPREEETRLISDAIERSLEVWPLIFAGEMEKAMHRLHTQPKD